MKKFVFKFEKALDVIYIKNKSKKNIIKPHPSSRAAYLLLREQYRQHNQGATHWCLSYQEDERLDPLFINPLEKRNKVKILKIKDNNNYGYICCSKSNSKKFIKPNATSRAAYLLLKEQYRRAELGDPNWLKGMQENKIRDRIAKKILKNNKRRITDNMHPIVARIMKASNYYKRRYGAWLMSELSKGDKIHCPCCSKELNVYNYTLDHHVPKSRGGSNELSNIVIMCRTCNRIKGNICPIREPSIYHYFMRNGHLNFNFWNLLFVPTSQLLSLLKEATVSRRLKNLITLRILFTGMKEVKRTNKISLIKRNKYYLCRDFDSKNLAFIFFKAVTKGHLDFKKVNSYN